VKICQTLTNIWQHVIKCGEFWSAFCLSKTLEKILSLESAENAKVRNFSRIWKCVFFANIGFETIGFRAAVDDPSKVCYNGLTPYNKKAWIPYSQPRREN
jgi:hypothetical protein